jgi:hypothetical protein
MKIRQRMLYILIGIIICLFLSTQANAYTFEVSLYSIVMRYSIKYNIEPKVVATLIAIESTYDLNATSSANAKGLMQITTIAAKEVDKNIALMYLPHYNVDTGCAYLRYLLDLKGNYKDAIKAYFQGPFSRHDNGGNKYYNKFKRTYKQLNLKDLCNITYIIDDIHLNWWDIALLKYFDCSHILEYLNYIEDENIVS